MSQENLEVVRGVRAPVTVSTESSQRTLDERILVRFPALCRLLASVWSRLPPRVRRPWTARLVLRGCQAANRRDFELMSVFQDPEVDVEIFVSDRSGSVFPDMVGRLRGREAYRRLWGAADEAYDDCRLEFDEFIDCGQRFLAGGRITGRGRHTGIALDQPIFQVFTHRRGLVVREEDFDNRDRALEAMGLSEYAMSQENVEVVRRLLDAQKRDDTAAVLACLDPGLEWLPLRAATEGAYHGHDGFEKFVADTNETFETFDPHFELRDLGEQVLAWGTVRVRGAGSGVEMDVPVGGIFDLRDGRIVRWQDFGAKEKALEAAGLSE